MLGEMCWMHEGKLVFACHREMVLPGMCVKERLVYAHTCVVRVEVWKVLACLVISHKGSIFFFFSSVEKLFQFVPKFHNEKHVVFKKTTVLFHIFGLWFFFYFLFFSLFVGFPKILINFWKLKVTCNTW